MTIRKLRLTFRIWNPATENPKTSVGSDRFINPAFFTIDVVHVCTVLEKALKINNVFHDLQWHPMRSSASWSITNTT